MDPGTAYRTLFIYEGADRLFAEQVDPHPPSWVERYLQQRCQPPSDPPKKPAEDGKRFVQGFLRYVVEPGGHLGWGSTGRNDLNDAHGYLAKLLEAQQSGRGWTTCAFCRTIFTTNFDTLLQVALQQVGLAYLLTDRPEKLDRTDLGEEETAIHLVYTHGSILRRNAASTMDEIEGLARKNIEVLRDYFQTRDVIIIGYSGWDDGLMSALRQCDPSTHRVYWCDVRPKPDGGIASFLGERVEGAAYVFLQENGADGLMRALYKALIPEEASQIR